MAEPQTPVGPDKLHAAPITVTIGQKEYRMRRTTVGDLAAVTARIRDERIAAVLRHQGGMRSADAARAVAHAATQDPTDADRAAFINSPWGAKFLLWRALSHYQVVAEAELERLIEQEGGLRDLLFAESGLVATEPPTAREDEQGADPSPAVFGK